MINTRLYFDKDFAPPPKEDLLLRMIGYSPISNENDAFILTHPTGKSGNIWEFAGKPRHHIEQQSYTIDDMLYNPSLLEFTSDQGELNNFNRMSKDGSYLTSYLHYSAFLPHNFKKLLNNQDIKYILRNTIVHEVTTDRGTTVALNPSFNPNNFLYLSLPDLTNKPEEGLNEALPIPQIYVDANLNNYVYDTIDPAGTRIKYIKVKCIYTAGIEVTEEAKKYINPLDPDLIVKERESTFYFLPPTKGILIDIYGVSGTYASKNLDYITAVSNVSLDKQVDGTWTLSYNFDLDNGAGVVMSGVSRTITHITDDHVKPGIAIVTDTTVPTAPVPFIIKSRY